jgi:hypothetical protein
VSCVVHSALVIGLAHFGDMHQIFPLDKFMYTARSLLQRFSGDSIAFRNCTIIQLLHEACQAYSEKRHAATMDIEGQLISSLFGQLHYTPPGSEQLLDPRAVPAYQADPGAEGMSLIDKTFGSGDAAETSWDGISGVAQPGHGQAKGASGTPPHQQQQPMQPLSPSSTPAAMSKVDDEGSVAPNLDLTSIFNGSNILGDADIVNLESQDELVSLYALIDTSGGYLGVE